MRRTSFERTPWTGDNSIAGSPVRTRSRMHSLERGARVAETGTLIPRARRESAAAGVREGSNGDVMAAATSGRLSATVVSG